MERKILKETIKSQGMKPSQVARHLGFHKTTLYNHLKCRPALGVQKAIKLAKFLNISLDDVYAAE